MNKKIILAGIISISLVFSVVVAYSNAIIPQDKLKYGQENLELKNRKVFDEKKHKELEAANKKNPKISINPSEESKADILKDKKVLDEEFDKRQSLKDQNDLEAGKILEKHYNKAIPVLVSDKNEDYKTMQLIVDAINSKNSFTEKEVGALKGYLSRRCNYIDDNPSLKSAIEKVLSDK